MAAPRHFRAPWGVGDLDPGTSSLVICVLLPIVARIAALIHGRGAELVALVAIGLFARSVMRAAPALVVTDTALSAQVGGTTIAASWVATPEVTDLVTLDVDETRTILASRRLGEGVINTAPFDAIPADLADDVPAGTTSSIVVESSAGGRRTLTLLPVWDPAHARPLTEAIAEASPQLSTSTATASLPPDGPAPRPPWRVVVGELRGGTLAVVAPFAAAAVVWAVSLVVRALTLDGVLGSYLGLVIIAAFRTIELTAAVAATTTAVVALTALLAWAREGEPIGPRDALRLGRVRSVWALWQLRVWLVGTGALIATTGATGARVALAYGAVTLAVPGAQLLRELVRRTVEETRQQPPPAMQRISQSHQWVAVVAAVVAHVLFRVL